MSTSIRPTHDTAERAHRAPEEILISDWALRNRPLGSLLAVALAAGVSWLAGWASGAGAIGAALGVLLLSTLWRTMLPIRYELGPAGISQSVLGWRRQIPWSAVRHSDIRSDGVVLSPAASQSAAPLRGLYLHWGDKREAVMAHLDYYVLGRTRGALGSSSLARSASEVH